MAKRSERTTRRIYDGRVIKFRSRLEARWSYYLDVLVVGKHIKRYDYEPEWFEFLKVTFGIRRYLPDFRVNELDGSVTYHECKGYLDAKSITKIRRFAKYYPDRKLWLIFDKLPQSRTEKSQEKLIIINEIKSRIDRVVEARHIFKQLGITRST